MNPLAWLNPGRWLLYVALAGSLYAGYLTWREHQREIGRDEVRAEVAAKALTDAEKQRAEERRRAAAQQEIIDEANAEAENARRDADAARLVSGRLQTQLAAYRSRACPNPSTAQGSEAAAAADRVLAEVQRRLDEIADRIAGFADQAHTAGKACERSYDALTP